MNGDGVAVVVVVLSCLCNFWLLCFFMLSYYRIIIHCACIRQQCAAFKYSMSLNVDHYYYSFPTTEQNHGGNKGNHTHIYIISYVGARSHHSLLNLLSGYFIVLVVHIYFVPGIYTPSSSSS